MADWKSTIELWDLHDKHRAGEIPVSEVAKGLAARLRKNMFFEDFSQLWDIADMLEDVDEVDDYDYALAELYDFGDVDHRIWINTTTPVLASKLFLPLVLALTDSMKSKK